MPIYKQKEKNKEGLFKYKVRINYTDDYGKHKQLTRTAWGAAAAKEMERKLILQLNNKETDSTITILQLYQEYNENTRYDVRQSTISTRDTVFEHHILPYIGSVKLSNLKTKQLTEWKNSVNEKGLSLRTRKNIYANLRACLNYAVKMDYIISSPLDKVDNFKDAYHQEKDVDFYTPEEFLKFKTAALTAAENSDFYDYYVFFNLAYYTGARKGEIHALRWNCIQNNQLSIYKSISQKMKGDDVETPPKNKSSIRTIQLPLPLMQVLNEHKKRQQKTIPNWKPTGFVCGYYRSLRDSSIEEENKKYAMTANIKKIRIHDFRHSHASLLINNNINPLEVAHRLGHSNVTQTLKTYSHLFPKETEKAIAVLNNIV